jgi:hypothetical protein
VLEACVEVGLLVHTHDLFEMDVVDVGVDPEQPLVDGLDHVLREQQETGSGCAH